jgi:NitT/TauT family transport system substrate-binding protein
MITRRAILKALGASLIGSVTNVPPGFAAEPQPETKRIRLRRYPSDVACLAPLWVAEDLLRSEGFETVEYVPTTPGGDIEQLAKGAIDMTFYAALGLIYAVTEGQPVVGLGGMHGGCYELIGSARVRSVTELRGRTVAVVNQARQAFVASMASYVGLDSRKDLKIVLANDAAQQFVDSKVDAVLGFPLEPQEFRARKIGRVIVNTGTDRPWSQYFCCFAIGNRDFVRKHPVATRRALRALVKGGRSLRSRARQGRARTRRARISEELRLFAAGAARNSIPTVARVRFGGHGPILRASDARGGPDQVEPATDHRRRHRLALRQRAQEGAEGVTRFRPRVPNADRGQGELL